MPRLGHACAAIVLLAACGQAPELIEPKADAATSARPTADAPTSAPPTMPPLAKRHDEIGAANFVLYWVNAFNFAAQTGDTHTMRMDAAACEPCSEYADDFDRLPVPRRVVGKAWTVESVAVNNANHLYQVETTVRALNEDRKYPLTFVVSDADPFELLDVYERRTQ
jgi:hypothetical protein